MSAQSTERWISIFVLSTPGTQRNSLRFFLHRAWAIEGNRPCLISILAITLFCVTSCVTTSPHEFSQPTADWHTKTGQLMYRSQKATLIGDALLRFSKTGDFE